MQYIYIHEKKRGIKGRRKGKRIKKITNRR